jgi:CRISPR/Cas system-associated endoribonuclease Cas2
MIVQKQELNDLYESFFEKEQKASGLKSQATELTNEVKDSIKQYAVDNEITDKVLTLGYEHFKKLKANKIPIEDASYYPIMNAVEEMFIKEE